MKSYTDLEQSKKLAEILPIESADHHYVRKTCDFRGNPVDGKWSIPKYGNPQSSHANYLVQNFTSYEIIPCWSLAALLSVIKPINENTYTIRGTLDGGATISFDEITNVMFQEEEIIDTIFEMVCWLKKNRKL